MYDFIYNITVFVYAIGIVYSFYHIIKKENIKDAQLTLIFCLVVFLIPYLNTLFLIGFIVFCIYDKLVLQKD